MNTLKDTRKAIQDAAERHGFRWEAPANGNFLPRIVSEDMNFLITPTVSPDSDWTGGKVRIDIAVCASVRRMGGSPTVEELLHTADEIRRGAELVRELQGMDLSYIHNI